MFPSALLFCFSAAEFTLGSPGWCTVKICKEKEIFQIFEPTITEKGSCNLHPSNESLNSFEYLIGDKTAANAKWLFFGVCREGRWFLRRRLIHVILWQASVAAAPRYSETRSSWLVGDFHGQIIRYHGKWSMREMSQNEKSLISRVDAWCLNGKKLHLWVQCRNVRRKSYHMEGWMKTALWKDYLRRFTVVAEEAEWMSPCYYERPRLLLTKSPKYVCMQSWICQRMLGYIITTLP